MSNDLKLTIRMLRKAPGFGALVILLLTLGIGANTAMFSILDAWLLEPLRFPAPDRLAVVLKSETSNPTEPKIFAAYRDWAEWARLNRSFTNIAGVFWRSFEGTDGEENQFGMIVTANLFDTLGVKPERGRTFQLSDVDGPPVAVIGDELWKNRFAGARDILGKTIALGSKTYRIIGVMPAGFGLRMINQDTDTQFYALIQKDEPAYSGTGNGPIAAIGRLRPGVTIQAAQAELAALQRNINQRYQDSPKGYTVLVTNLQKDNTRNVRASLWLSAAALGFVLLIVCANVGSLLLGRTLKRRREMAIRVALGSGRSRIVRQLLTESALLTALGAVGGLSLAYATLRIFTAVNPFGRMPPNPIAVDWRALAFTLVASLASTLLLGLAPALEAARVDLNDAMKAAGRSVTGGRGAFRLRGLLVSGQVALSLMLVVGAALMIQTLLTIESQPLGFRPQGITVASVAIPKDRWNDISARRLIYERLLSTVKSTSGVADAAISNASPVAGGFEDRFSIEGWPAPTEESAPTAGTQSVTPDYFRTLSIPLIAGRNFSEYDDRGATPVVILNRSAAQRWFASRSPVGARLKLRGDKDWRTVVGVAGDTSYTFYNTIQWLRGPRIFLPAQQAGAGSISPVAREVYLIVHGRDITAASARSLLKSADPVLRLGRLETLPDMVAGAVQQPRLRTRVLAALALLSLLLASIGIYGVMAQSVVERTQEIGIRMALGARSADLIRMVVTQGIRLALGGIAAGIAAALAMTKIIATLLYGVKPTNLATFVTAALILLFAVVLAALLPARAAARQDPITALRQD